MLNLTERIVYALSGLVIVGALGLYLWQPPEKRSIDLLPKAKKSVAAAPAAAAPKPEEKSGPRVVGPAEEIPAEDKAILDLLANEQNLRIAGKKLVREDYTVDKDTFDFVTREANWFAELKKVGSQTLPGKDGRMTRLKVSNLSQDSLLKDKFDFQDGDIIELIEGQIIDFNADAKGSLEYHQLWKGAQEKLSGGGVVSVTLTRGGQPMNMQFRL